MAETNVKITLELADKAAQKALKDFISSGDKAGKSLDKTKKKGKSTFDEITVSIGKSIGVYDIFAGNLAANIVTKAFDQMLSAANALFQTFVVNGIKAAQEQEDAINSLNQALALSGKYSEETSLELQNYAKHLENTTTVAGSVVLENAALIQSLGGLEKDGLKRATKAAMDMSAALGIDLKAAATLVGKAAVGEISSFTRYGVAIQKGATDAETFTNALTALEAKFGGTAESKVKTFSGAIAQAQNSFGSFTEEIGNLIVKNPVLIATINEATKIFQELTQSVSDNNSGLMNLVSSGIVGLLKSMTFVTAMVDVAVKSFQYLYGVFQLLMTPVVGLAAAFKTLIFGIDETAAELNNFFRDTQRNLAAFRNDTAISDVGVTFARLSQAADAAFNNMMNGANKSVGPINNVGGAVTKLSEEAKKAQDDLKRFAEQLINQGDTKGLENLRAELQAKRDIELAELQATYDQKLISEIEYLTQKAAIEEQFAVSQAELELERFEQDKARLQSALDQKLISQEQYNDAVNQLEANAHAQSLQRDAERTKRDIQNKKQMMDAEKRLNEQKVNAAAQTFGALSSLMQTTSKHLFEIGKISAIAQATINTYQAVTKTLADGGAWAAPLAAAVAVQGFVQVANIRNTQPSFQNGGVVGGFVGATAGPDNIQVNARRGEMILNATQQRNLFEMANTGASGTSGNIEQLLSRLISTIETQPIVVNIGGRTVVETIRSELESGRTFA